MADKTTDKTVGRQDVIFCVPGEPVTGKKWNVESKNAGHDPELYRQDQVGLYWQGY